MLATLALSSIGVCGGVNIGEMLDERSSFNVISSSDGKSIAKEERKYLVKMVQYRFDHTTGPHFLKLFARETKIPNKNEFPNNT